MACRRIAGAVGELAVTIQRIAFALAAIIGLAGLGGCASQPSPIPGSIAEQLWFDKATGYDINNVPQLARIQGLRGYPHTDPEGVRFLPPPPYEQ